MGIKRKVGVKKSEVKKSVRKKKWGGMSMELIQDVIIVTYLYFLGIRLQNFGG